MNFIRCYSIQFTGTHFLHKLLRSHGFCVNGTHFGTEEVTGVTVCPIRDPWNTYVSWSSRNYLGNDYFKQWERFNKAFLDNEQLFILPIDTEDKDHYLDILSVLVNKKLHTDWEKESSRPNKIVEEVDLSHIYKLPVVEKFYGYGKGNTESTPN